MATPCSLRKAASRQRRRDATLLGVKRWHARGRRLKPSHRYASTQVCQSLRTVEDKRSYSALGQRLSQTICSKSAKPSSSHASNPEKSPASLPHEVQAEMHEAEGSCKPYNCDLRGLVPGTDKVEDDSLGASGKILKLGNSISGNHSASALLRSSLPQSRFPLSEIRFHPTGCYAARRHGRACRLRELQPACAPPAFLA